MDLTSKIGDKKGETMAMQYMGFVNASEGKYDDGCNMFEQAFELAEQENNKKVEYISKCSYGMANAELKLDNYLRHLVDNSKRIADDHLKSHKRKDAEEE